MGKFHAAGFSDRFVENPIEFSAFQVGAGAILTIEAENRRASPDLPSFLPDPGNRGRLGP